MRTTRRNFVAGTLAIGCAPKAACAAVSQTFTPEMFGARGDGRTNDTRAFAALSAHINKLGGGTIALRPVTYIVGEQSQGGQLAFTPSDILHLTGCPGPVVIQGNGGKLRAAPGLRYGGFDRSGRPLPLSRSNLQLSNRAAPYSAMILIERCTGSIDISDIELDGNNGALHVGGQWGESGWEAATYGIWLQNIDGPARISSVHSHHHAQDGLIIMPNPNNSGAIFVTDVICDYNARQGCTVSSGRNISFQRCSFRHTGRAPPLFKNRPGAGVDVEAERGPIRNVSFSECEFSDNAGFGLVAGSGDSADISFATCKFIGTTNFAAWADKPGMRFNDCLFVGQVTHLYADPNPSRAAQFVGCTFTDDPSLSPTGQVFMAGGFGNNSAAIATPGANVSFRTCHFRMVRGGLLPRSDGAIYEDCDMSQRSPAPSAPRGRYLGTDMIRGNAHLEGSDIQGQVSVNGQILPRNS